MFCEIKGKYIRMTTEMGRFREKTAALQQCVWFLVLLVLLTYSEPVNGFSIGAKIQQSGKFLYY